MAWFAVTDLVRNWRYALPLGINLSGSLWFFLLVGGSGKFIFFYLFVQGRNVGKRGCGWIGCADKMGTKTELSLTVPIVNTTAFLFTVIGEWWVEGKVISRGEYPLFLPLGRSAWSKRMEMGILC